jgi:peroxiredoxin Q/BCP
MVEEASRHPIIELTTDSGETVRSPTCAGSRSSSTSTPGTTPPAAPSRRAESAYTWDAFPATGAEVFGISPDGEESHAKFKQKHALPFTHPRRPRDHEVTER